MPVLKQERYFPTLLGCIAASLLLLVAAHVLLTGARALQGVLLGAAMLPLMFYHLVFLSSRSWTDGSAIDSVYYYGFLLTVAALAVSALGVAFDRVETSDVLFNFGLGICATGYAVLARMHLLSRVPIIESDQAADAAMTSYIAKTSDLVSDVEMVSHRLRSFADMILTESTGAHTAALSRMQEAMVTSTTSFQQQLSQAIEPVLLATKDLRELVTDPSFAAERAAFAKSLSQATRATKAFDGVVQGSASQLGTAGQIYTAALAALATATAEMQKLSDNLGRLAGDEGTLVKAGHNVEVAAETTARAIARTGTSLASLQAMSEQLNSAGGALAQLRSFAEGTERHLGAMVKASDRLGAAVHSIDAATASLASLEPMLKEAGAAIPALTTDLRQLSIDLTQLRASVSEAATSLESDVSRSAQASSMLTESLVNVAQTIVDSTRARVVS